MKLLSRCILVFSLLAVVGTAPGSRSVSAQSAPSVGGCQKSIDGSEDLDGLRGGRGSWDSSALNCLGVGGDCDPLVI